MANERAGREIDIVWRGDESAPYVPTLLAHRDLTLSARTVAGAATAAAEVGHAAEALTGDYEALAHLLLRSEGVASSYIEGIKAPVVDIVLAGGKARSGRYERRVGGVQPRSRHRRDRDRPRRRRSRWRRCASGIAR